MGNFSRDPNQLLAVNVSKGYVGVRIEQDVPLLDRDVNLLGDLLGASLREVIREHIGDGAAVGSDSAFAVIADLPVGNDFRIGPGTMLVGGIQVNSGPGYVKYSTQNGAPALKPPGGVQTRIDTVYLDVWLQEVDMDQDPGVDLANTSDIGVQTSIRLKPAWMVRVAEGEPPPSPLLGHAHCVLAELNRSGAAILSEQIVDQRVKRLQLADLVTRVTALEGELAVLKAFLQPVFSSTRAFDKPGSYAGRVVTMYGHNFDLGQVTVYLKVGQAGVWQPQQIIGDPQPNSITVRIHEAPPTGDANFIVKTVLGTAESPLFRVWGPAAFDSLSPYSNAWPNPDEQILIKGVFFDVPGFELQYASLDDGLWHPLPFDSESQGKVSVLVNAPKFKGQFKVQLRSEMNPKWVDCPQDLVVVEG